MVDEAGSDRRPLEKLGLAGAAEGGEQAGGQVPAEFGRRHRQFGTYSIIDGDSQVTVFGESKCGRLGGRKHRRKCSNASQWHACRATCVLVSCKHGCQLCLYILHKLRRTISQPRKPPTNLHPTQVTMQQLRRKLVLKAAHRSQ